MRACPTPVLVTWGGREQAEFARQSLAWRDAWRAAGNRVELLDQPDAQHFSAIHGFEDPDSALCDWLEWMGFVDSGSGAKLDRFIGYYESYAESHDTFDADHDVQEEVKNVARAVSAAVVELRAGRLSAPDRRLKRPRPK